MTSVDQAHARLQARLADLAGREGSDHEAQRQRLRRAMRGLARTGEFPDAAQLDQVSLAPWVLADADTDQLLESAPDTLPLDYLLWSGGREWEHADAGQRRAYLDAARERKRRHTAGRAIAERSKREVDADFAGRALFWGGGFLVSRLMPPGLGWFAWVVIGLVYELVKRDQARVEAEAREARAEAAEAEAGELLR